MDDTLMHYGTPRHSGRYPWGSGDNPYQHEDWFLKEYNKYKSEGYSDTEIAHKMGMSTTEFRQKRSLSQTAQRQAMASDVARLHDEEGLGWTEISKKMDIPESTVRNLYNPILDERSKKTNNTADALKASIAEKTYIDIGPGVENYMGVSRTKLKTAVRKLQEEGYEVHTVYIEQLGTGKKTATQIVCPPGTDYAYISKHPELIKLPIEYTENGGRTFLGLEPIQSVDSSRIMVRYSDDPESGKLKDGVIELRPGVEDLSLGGKQYAQVRIGVDGTHYLKGMAMYGTDMPDGIDIIVNSNKPRGTPIKGTKDSTVFKPMSDNEDNPFGATIKQRHYIGADGKEHLSPINIVASGNSEDAKVNEEGRWGEWSRTLSSQFLSKQSVPLAERQLGIAYNRMAAEHDELISLTNPVVKQQLLLKFAEECDSSAVHLKAAALPRQSTHVILPITDMPENQIYAPNYRDGEEVVLIRYPHGGIFEIPRLTVNNKQQTALKVMPNSKDAVGINPKVAQQLSGADFDGDTVVVIPTSGVKIKTMKGLEGLKDFDTDIYKLPPEAPRIKSKTKNTEMGKISNLITDMTLQGATEEELCRAVKHSMVVIDSEKHHLDYRKSFEDNDIAKLKEKYQGGARKGASTLISRASAEIHIDELKELTPSKAIDIETGKKIKQKSGRTYTVPKYDKDGNVVGYSVKKATQTSTRMAEVDDAFELSSGTEMETVYAIHANKLKSLANQARKEAMSIKMPKTNESAKKVYSAEVASLISKLNTSRKNKPLERQAQARAGYRVKEQKAANPDLKNDKEGLKKIKNQALEEARYEVGSKSRKERGVKISEKEWEAIQAGAVSPNRLRDILANADEAQIRQLATPRERKELSESKIARIRSMANQNYSTADIADALGVSTSTVQNYMN